MLTIMCPNCRHRFPAPGCCNPEPRGRISVDHEENKTAIVENNSAMRNNDSLYSGGYLLVPREFDENSRGCFINAPTIIHGPTIIQQPSLFDKLASQASSARTNDCSMKGFNRQQENSSSVEDSRDYRTGTSCDLTGGTVTITTPNVQSGGCLIRSRDTDIFIRSPRIEIIPKLTGGGGCYVQDDFPIVAANSEKPNCRGNQRNETTIQSREEPEDGKSLNYPTPPSGCQELPGTRTNFSSSSRINTHDNRRNIVDIDETKKRDSCCCCGGKTSRESTSFLKNNESNGCRSSSSSSSSTNVSQSRTNDNGGKKFISNDCNRPMEIRVNATVQLPPNVGHCTVNITATTGNGNVIDTGSTRAAGTRRDNFNGGGLVQFDNCTNNEIDNSTTTAAAAATNIANERRDDNNTPTTPLSWIMPCSWGFDNYPSEKDVTRLTEIKRLLQIGGWYHEGLCWQQSETLLKNTPVGRWLMRDSSDSRFIFAVSVQTARGPTSVRVHYFFGKFRLDAEPRLSLAMPLFDCPIKMLQHYVDYSKRIDEHREEVWVDYNGQLYSQIYLTKPLVKEVQTLSHLARIAVNSNQLRTDHLPPLIKNYLAEYPYSL